MKFLPLLLFMLASVAANAQAIPLDKLAIRLVPRSEEAAGDVGVKTIKIAQSDSGVKLAWFSMVKELDPSAVYTTYKIRAKRGMIEINDFDGKNALFLPHLWGNGYINTQTSLPLWLSPDYLSEGKQAKMFNVGLVNADKNLLKLAPAALLTELNYFQNLYDQYVQGLQTKTLVNLKKSDEKELRDFIRDFFYVRLMAKTKATLVANGIKENYPAKIIGNDYFHLVVVDDVLNPLVVTLKIFPEKAPQLFKKSFDYFKKNFEFVVTQVNY